MPLCSISVMTTSICQPFLQNRCFSFPLVLFECQLCWPRAPAHLYFFWKVKTPCFCLCLVSRRFQKSIYFHSLQGWGTWDTELSATLWMFVCKVLLLGCGVTSWILAGSLISALFWCVIFSQSRMVKPAWDGELAEPCPWSQRWRFSLWSSPG